MANEDDASDDLDGEDGVEDLVVQLKPEDVVNRIKAESDFSTVIQLKALTNQDVESVVKQVKELIKG